MATRTIQAITEVKSGRNWYETTRDNDPRKVYDSLAHDLIAKKLNGCTYIRSIKRAQHYDGYITVTVTYDNDVRTLYTVEDR